MDREKTQIKGWGQDYSNSIADALELPQPCTKPSIYIPNVWMRHLNPRRVASTAIECRLIRHFQALPIANKAAIYYPVMTGAPSESK